MLYNIIARYCDRYSAIKDSNRCIIIEADDNNISPFAYLYKYNNIINLHHINEIYNANIITIHIDNKCVVIKKKEYNNKTFYYNNNKEILFGQYELYEEPIILDMD